MKTIIEVEKRTPTTVAIVLENGHPFSQAWYTPEGELYSILCGEDFVSENDDSLPLSAFVQNGNDFRSFALALAEYEFDKIPRDDDLIFAVTDLNRTRAGVFIYPDFYSYHRGDRPAVSKPFFLDSPVAAGFDRAVFEFTQQNQFTFSIRRGRIPAYKDGRFPATLDKKYQDHLLTNESLDWYTEFPWEQFFASFFIAEKDFNDA